MTRCGVVAEPTTCNPMPTAAPPADTFRVPFWRMYLPAVMYAQALYGVGMWLVFFALSRFDGEPFPTVPQAVVYAVNSTLVSLLLIPAFLIYVRKLVVRVSADGFTCPNGVGRMRTVGWGDITGVRRLTLPGFPYLLVTTTRTRLKLWLPLFLGRLPEFAEKVEQFAGPDHLLYQAVWPTAERQG